MQFQIKLLQLALALVLIQARAQVLVDDPKTPINAPQTQEMAITALPHYSDIESIKEFIANYAMSKGVSSSTALFIVKHESNFDPNRIGDDDKTCPVGQNRGKKQHSRGLWQISDCYHPEVSDKVAFDIVSSTEWAIENIKAGKIDEWSTWRFRND